MARVNDARSRVKPPSLRRTNPLPLGSDVTVRLCRLGIQGVRFTLFVMLDLFAFMIFLFSPLLPTFQSLEVSFNCSE